MRNLSYKFIVFAILLASFSLSAQEKPTPAILGNVFPDFKMLSHEGKQVWFSDLQGKKVILVFPRGKVTDAYWCALCHYQYAEMVKLEMEKKIRQKNKLEIYFVLPYPKDSVDKWIADLPKSMTAIEKWKNQENPVNEKQKKKAEAFNKACPINISYKDGKFPFPIPVLIDPEHSFSSKIGLYQSEWDGTKTGQNIPTIFILDEQGVVRFKFMSQNTFDRPHADYLLEFVRKMI